MNELVYRIESALKSQQHVLYICVECKLLLFISLKLTCLLLDTDFKQLPSGK